MTAKGDKPPSRLTKILWGAFFAVVFGPFALLFAFAFIGVNIGGLPGFGEWFMLALTFCGAFTFVSLIVDGIKTRRVEWLLIVISGGATYWWARIALKPFL